MTAAAYAREGGQRGYPGPAFTHVIVMGHRRAAAAAVAGRDAVPVIVRDDLAGAPAIAAMIAENRHRAGLDPLAEARAMSALIERHGWRQRRVAAEIGCSQAHVSKRMSLLQLPDRARDALADGKVSVETALELHKLTGAGVDVAQEAIAEAVGELVQGQHPNYALSRARDRVKRAVAAEETRKDLEARGTEIITEQRRAKMNWPMVYGDTTAHAEGGCLAAMISNWTGAAEYVCTNPASHPQEIPAHSRHEARAAEDEREGKKAARLRDIACAAIAGGPDATRAGPAAADHRGRARPRRRARGFDAAGGPLAGRVRRGPQGHRPLPAAGPDDRRWRPRRPPALRLRLRAGR